MFRAFLDMLARVERATICFVMSVLVEQLGSCWMNFHGIIILYLHHNRMSVLKDY